MVRSDTSPGSAVREGVSLPPSAVVLLSDRVQGPALRALASSSAVSEGPPARTCSRQESQGLCAGAALILKPMGRVKMRHVV